MSMSETKQSHVLSLMDKFRDIRNNLQKLWLGRVLTIVDASIQDPEQRKAVKDLVKNAFYESEGWTQDMEWHLLKYKNKHFPDLEMPKWEAEHWENIKRQNPTDEIDG